MSAHFNVAREVQSKLDEALRKKAADLGVWKAVYFNVVIDFRDPTGPQPGPGGICAGDSGTRKSYENT